MYDGLGDPNSITNLDSRTDDHVGSQHGPWTHLGRDVHQHKIWLLSEVLVDTINQRVGGVVLQVPHVCTQQIISALDLAPEVVLRVDLV